MDYSFGLTARVLLYVPSQRQDSTYHGYSGGFYWLIYYLFLFSWFVDFFDFFINLYIFNFCICCFVVDGTHCVVIRVSCVSMCQHPVTREAPVVHWFPIPITTVTILMTKHALIGVEVLLTQPGQGVGVVTSETDGRQSCERIVAILPEKIIDVLI